MTASIVKPIRADTLWQKSELSYSICTLVTRPQEYAEMVASFQAKGFVGPDCEFLFLDNSEANSFDAYAGYNLFLGVARGKFVILCHQDILLECDDRQKLDEVVAVLDRRDPTWAACGNAGGVAPGRLTLRLTDPHGADPPHEKLPALVQSLDENFIVVKRQANLALSHDLSGFHLYGADLCLIGSILGRTSYVVDFNLRHKSPGGRGSSLTAARSAFIVKYRRSFRSRWMVTTCAILFLSGVPLLARLMNLHYVTRVFSVVGDATTKLRTFMSRD